MRRTTTDRHVATCLATAVLTSMTIAAGPSAPDRGSTSARQIDLSPDDRQPQVLDLRERRFRVAYLYLDDRGLTVGDVHGRWSSIGPAARAGVTGLAPFAGQTRIATGSTPVVIEGDWLGNLHSFELELYTHLLQEDALAALDALAITVAIDGHQVFEGDVDTLTRSMAFDSHHLHYGLHRVGFDGIAEAMSEAGLDGPGPHRLRLEVRPSSDTATLGVPLVFDTHRTHSAVRLNTASDWVPRHIVG